MSREPYQHRVVIIGWDGATYDLIDPWIAEGKLPNLARFLKNSVRAPMQSTTPHFTYPAWTSFLTGKNPGRHGVFDFTERVPGTHRIQFVNGRSVRARTIWRLLSDQGLRVGCMGVPVSYPPDAINGILICGFDAPGSGAKTDSSSVHPPELLNEIQANVGEYITASNIMPLMSKDRHEEALDQILHTMEMKGKTAKYLLEREAWDVFMVLFGESDLIGHHFWRFTDPNSPLYEKSSSQRVRNAIYHVYEKLDEMLPWLLEACPEDCVKLVVSDHGFGGSSDRVIYMNNWLEQEGFLKYSGERGAQKSMGYRMVNTAKNWGLRFLPPAIKTYIFRKRPDIAGRMEAYLRFGGIDWANTTAFSEELPYMQSIWINVKGREPHGTVSPGREYDAVIDQLREKLAGWVDPDTGEKVVEQVLHRRDIYDGPFAERAPDLILKTRHPNGYAYQGKSSRQSKDSDAIVTLDRKDPNTLKFYAAKSGSHRDYGIFMAQGPMFTGNTRIDNARLWDVTPTVLYLLGQPIPADMDGNVLVDAMKPDYVQSRPLASAEADGTLAATAEDKPTYAPDEVDAINKQLQDLGYLE